MTHWINEIITRLIVEQPRLHHDQGWADLYCLYFFFQSSMDEFIYSDLVPGKKHCKVEVQKEYFWTSFSADWGEEAAASGRAIKHKGAYRGIIIGHLIIISCNVWGLIKKKLIGIINKQCTVKRGCLNMEKTESNVQWGFFPTKYNMMYYGRQRSENYCFMSFLCYGWTVEVEFIKE